MIADILQISELFLIILHVVGSVVVEDDVVSVVEDEDVGEVLVSVEDTVVVAKH